MAVGASLVMWLFACVAQGSAQTSTATLFVQVHDSQGGRVPDARVELRMDAPSLSRRAVTDASGTATFAAVPAGAGSLSVSKPGFREGRLSPLHLAAGAKLVATIVLEPGPIDEVVTVTAPGRVVRIGNSAVGEVYEAGTLVLLPVRERDVLSFAQQTPGVAPPAPGSRLSTEGNVAMNAAGARESANNFLLDGVDNNDPYLNRVLVTPSLEAVDQVAVVSSTYDAEYGRNAGAQVQVVVKSGGREREATVYERYRDAALAARNPMADPHGPEPGGRGHQFGATLGGAIGSWPSFYFGAIERTDARFAETRAARVPTAEERAGDFSASATTIRDPLTGRPFPGNRIPAERLDPVGLRVAALFPPANRAGALNHLASPDAEREGWLVNLKADERFWRSTSLFVRYSLADDRRTEPFSDHGRNLPGFPGDLRDTAQQVAGGMTHVIGPGLVNELRAAFGWARRSSRRAGSAVDGFAVLGMRGPSLPADDQGYPSIELAGYETLGDDPNLPLLRDTRSWHISDSVIVDTGRHLIKAGGELRGYASDGYNHLMPRGQIFVEGAFTGDALADLLLGLPTFSLLGVNDNPQALRTWAINGFIQDDWRVSPSLTVNAGLRYELNAAPYDANDRMRIFDQASGSLRPVGEQGVPRSGLRADRNNLAPRLGVSWDASGNGRYVFRGGYGLFHDAGTLLETSALYFNPPFFTLSMFVPRETPLALADPFPASSGFSTPPAVNTLAPEFETARAQQMSFGVETVIAGATIEARYVGARGAHLVRKRNINQPPPGPGEVQARRPYPGFGDILLVESEARSQYDSLQLLAQRSGGGLWLRAGYTWSRALDAASAFLESEGNENTPQDSAHPEAEWGPSDFAVRHRAVLGASYVTPDAAPAWLRGWAVALVATIQSGRPFTPRIGFDNSNTGNIGGTYGRDRPNEISPAEAAHVPGARFYDGRAFVVPPPYTFGNAGRNTLTGPGYASVDVAIARELPLGGRRRLELRAEIFNLLNRRNAGLPDPYVDRPTFGQSLSAYPAREAQLGVRVRF